MYHQASCAHVEGGLLKNVASVLGRAPRANYGQVGDNQTYVVQYLQLVVINALQHLQP